MDLLSWPHAYLTDGQAGNRLLHADGVSVRRHVNAQLPHCGSCDARVHEVVVNMPATWRDEGPTTYTFGVTDQELDPEGYSRYYANAARTHVRNPRLITPGFLQLSSL